jgi:hypothetical protein
MKRSTLLTAAAVSAAFLACDLAHAELVPVLWDSSGRFVHATRVEPGKFVEVCERLPKGTQVAWSFRSATPMDFNIHYHEGQAVKFPAKKNASSSAQGVLNAAVEQDFCWMWTNKRKAAANLQLTLKRG